ncbi:MAG: hypothetical protein KGH65_05440 [Candidatus Micrarchaeota archaeon]|nr:hypothetical protein [Candidatus Micrarchaeota archaeon]
MAVPKNKSHSQNGRDARTAIIVAAVGIALLAAVAIYANSSVPSQHQTLAQFFSANPQMGLDNFSGFIEPRLENVSTFNVSYLTEGYAMVNGTKSGKNFSINVKKFYDNYTTFDTDLGVNRSSILVQLKTVNKSYEYATFLCSRTPLPLTLANGTKVEKGKFICQKRDGISAEDGAYSPFEDSLGLSSTNTTTTGGLYNSTVLSANFTYLGDSCTLVRSYYTVDTQYNISASMAARYASHGILTQCISNRYFVVLFGKFQGTSDITYPKFDNGTIGVLNLTGAPVFYQINATAINNQVNGSEVTSMPGPLAEYPQNVTR